MSIESHPFQPFLPAHAQLLMLGTFPPSPKRWCVSFYYPNFTNDMWRIIGLCFFGDKMHFVRQEAKTYNLDALIPFLKERGVALFDTATRIIRTKNTASDKDLDIVEETDLAQLLARLPQCRAVVTAGQLATTVACRQFGISEPRVGEFSTFAYEGRELRLYRMPSSSRAYPMAVEKKSEVYQNVFKYLKTLNIEH